MRDQAREREREGERKAEISRAKKNTARKKPL